MEMDAKTYGEIMEALGVIRTDIKNLGKMLEDANTRIDTRLEKLEERVCALEKRPAGWWDKLVGAGIGAVVAAVVATVIK